MRIALVAAFLATVAAPGIGLIARTHADTVSAIEMRDLAPWPAWSWHLKSIAAWPAAFKSYFVDHFAFRDSLIHWRAEVYWRGFGASSTDTVMAGRNGWLFYADDGGLQDYVQTDPFPKDDLEAWRITLEKTRDWLAAKGIRYLVVFAPDKPAIYPEYMPTSLRRMSPDYRVDRLLRYLGQTSDLDVIDLRPILTAAALKSPVPLYDPYDTHWNDRGGLVGYEAITSKLHQWFPAIVPTPIAGFIPSSSVMHPAGTHGDLARMMGLAAGGGVEMGAFVPREGRVAKIVEPAVPNPYGEDGRVVTEIAGSTLPRAVIFRDSFTSRLIPYLSEHFSRAVYLWENDFDPDVVSQEHPDVVIQEYVARHLFTFVPSPELVPAPISAKASR
jgi:alginate O-acetyltransferase complex protein AlgJ